MTRNILKSTFIILLGCLILHSCGNSSSNDSSNSYNSESNDDSSYESSDNSAIQNEIYNLSVKNEELMEGMRNGYEYYVEQLTGYGRDLSTDTYNMCKTKRSQMINNLDKIIRLANQIGESEIADDAERQKGVVDGVYNQIMQANGW